MWSSLCNFFYEKLFRKPEVKSRVSGNDTSLDPLYGKRIKMSYSNRATQGWFNQPGNIQRFEMQAQENLNNSDDDECVVIAEIPRRNVVRPSAVSVIRYAGGYRKESSVRGDLFTPPSLQGNTSQKVDDSKDIEIVQCKPHLKRNLSTTILKKKTKFFNTKRASLRQSKSAKSRKKYRNSLRNKLGLLQQSYRLSEKVEYVQIIRSNKSFKAIPAKSGQEPIPVIDLTDENENKGNEIAIILSPTEAKKSSDDQEVQIIREIPAVRSFEDMIKIRPVNTGEMETMGSENTPAVITLSEFDQDLIELLNIDINGNMAGHTTVLEGKLLKFMQLTCSPGHEVTNCSEETLKYFFPEVTREEEKKVKEALSGGSSQKVLAIGFGLVITNRDMETLSTGHWLNDEIINFYMQLIMDRSQKNETLPKVYAFNTFFYPKLVSKGFISLKRWTKKVDIFSYDLILIPIHLGMHWCLCVIDFRFKTIKYYDSISTPNDACLEKILLYLMTESLDKKKQDFPVKVWRKYNVKDIPQQMNGNDCGVFTCIFAEHIARDAPLTFTQHRMPYYRKKIIVEILEGRILT